MLTRFRKLAKVLLLAAIMVITIVSLVHIDNGLTRSIPSLLPLRFQLIYKDITDKNLSLDTSQEFQARLHEISVEKFDDDSNSVFPFLRPEYVPATSITIPRYYQSQNDQLVAKPPAQPFDPRFTLAIYLHWLRLNPNKQVPFHWSDWVDVSELNQYIFSHPKKSCASLFQLSSDELKEKDKKEIRPVSEYCSDDASSPLGFKVTQFPMAHNRSRAQLLGKAHLYTSFAAPRRLLFLSNERGSYGVDLANSDNNLQHSLLHNGMVESVLGSLNTYNVDVLDAYKSFLKTFLRENKKDNVPLELKLNESQFDIDIGATIAAHEQSKNPMVKEYVNALKFSQNTESPAKSFNEAKFLYSDPNRLLGDHHDWRFFNGITLNTPTQELALHRLVKNFLHFCGTHGITTWIAHGSLLSWYWNGMSFPWDADTDVQMPIQELHRLARDFNQTLVVENIGHDTATSRFKDMEFNGMGLYFIDVGNSITHRAKGNGNNNIDARFMDIHTGLYVDITGLAVSEETAPSRYGRKAVSGDANAVTAGNKKNKLYNCRNRHFVSLDEVSPLVMTGVQNQVGYVPKNFAPMLDHEYGEKGFLQYEFAGHYYVSSLRLWVPSNNLGDYMKDPVGWTNKQRGLGKRDLRPDEVVQIGQLSVDEHADLLYNDKLFQQYVTGKEFTFFHQEQINALVSSRMGKFKSLSEEFRQSKSTNRALWGDIFINRVSKGEWNYEKEVQKLSTYVPASDTAH